MRTLAEAIADAVRRGFFVAFRRELDAENFIHAQVWRFASAETDLPATNVHCVFPAAHFASNSVSIVEWVDSAGTG